MHYCPWRDLESRVDLVFGVIRLERLPPLWEDRVPVGQMFVDHPGAASAARGLLRRPRKGC
jgi:hypothetical protein